LAYLGEEQNSVTPLFQLWQQELEEGQLPRSLYELLLLLVLRQILILELRS
jgi:hypothetical protein